MIYDCNTVYLYLTKVKVNYHESDVFSNFESLKSLYKDEKEKCHIKVGGIYLLDAVSFQKRFVSIMEEEKSANPSTKVEKKDLTHLVQISASSSEVYYPSLMLLELKVV